VCKARIIQRLQQKVHLTETSAASMVQGATHKVQRLQVELAHIGACATSHQHRLAAEMAALTAELARSAFVENVALAEW
jgi:hypothetical protein